MMQQVLAHYHLPGLACLGLLLFVAVFAGAVAWVFRKGSGGYYRALERLPLADDAYPETETRSVL
jgi:cbb3-type cytochrome oxidase subunit 3